ncbi:hypothetical protein PEZ29_003438, partial [Escherichia coli]|nr:hypothetical protein [Escherichia coli]EKI5264956.1 hypothetical protein [Escherichia coli]
MRQQQDEPGRFSICSRQAAVVQLAKRTSNGVDEYFWTATAVETRDEGTQTDNSSRTDSGTQTDNGPQTNNGTQTDSGTPVSPVT